MPVLSSLESIYTTSDVGKNCQRDRLGGMILSEPTADRILDISRMTYHEDDRKEIQKIIYQSLGPASTCNANDIHHALILLQKCLPVASLEFKNFCIGIRYLVKPLQKGKTQDIRDAARSLTEVIDDVARRESQVQKRTTPFPTPPSSPEVFAHPSLPGVSHKEHHAPKVSQINGKSSRATSNQRNLPGGTILELEKEVVARMTFSPMQLIQILKTLDGRLKLRFSNENITEEIVQALTLVHYCLLRGSNEFVEHYRTMKATFITFKDHRNSQVSSHARPIASLLDDHSRLKRERDRAMSENRSR